MDGIRIPSIKISDIDMRKCYFNPGCALSIYKPESGKKILDMLNKYFGPVQLHSICCHHDPKLPHGATIINNCAGCDRRFRSLYEGVQTISLWEVLDSIGNLSLPDHTELTVSVHDSCSYRPKPQVHAAVRNILRKMNMEIIDSKYSGTKSICCGDNFYPQLPIEKVTELQKKRAAQMPCQDVVVYCVSCIKSMTIGGKTPHHMADLVLNEETEPQETRIDVYHEALNQYIDEH
ncbi:putative iron-sulfur binding reductase [Desulfosporosinus sp. I2]|uniref:heterodisulfide reductase-related iron-sulfur binding cluster n=1 Tax=Desulfosporosinus sp. I2 TaxID=1617025 RepID=UPI00061EABD4|nr:heterodisulfide reductase-related iron-sulfur binding cluster [Desulfosporosinus sp. I2]KJR45098.1 putative iron-sulfur binding reductase [Desulfosporosinus sp. I2]